MSEQTIVQQLLMEGYAYPCACCKKMWIAKARGYSQCHDAFVRGIDCGGPMSGMSFPRYDGPLTVTHLATHCFRCGETAVEAVSSRLNPDRLIGVCKKHLPTLDRLIPSEDLRKASG